MSEDKKHTPLPYFITAHNGIGIPFWRVSYCKQEIGGEYIVIAECTNKTNAEFIVRACNSHYKLLGLAKIFRGSINNSLCDSDIPGNSALLKARQDKLRLVDEAIAKAEGK